MLYDRAGLSGTADGKGPGGHRNAVGNVVTHREGLRQGKGPSILVLGRLG